VEEIAELNRADQDRLDRMPTQAERRVGLVLSDVNATFMQPFLAYTTPTQWTFGFNTESSYDWENEQWSVPVNASASKLLRFGTQLVSVGGGLRYWLDSPDSGADGVGFRITVTLLFPR
jgi:hypothetical protein